MVTKQGLRLGSTGAHSDVAAAMDGPWPAALPVVRIVALTQLVRILLLLGQLCQRSRCSAS